jgi:hypothetical protein
MAHRFDTGFHAEQDQRMNAAAVGDPPSVVRKLLEELAPCETGYAGVTSCKACDTGHWCADILERALEQRIPSMDWRPAIREVLGLW